MPKSCPRIVSISWPAQEEGELDVVPSDVGLGFVMLRHVQAQRRMIARRHAQRRPFPRRRLH